MSKKKKAIKKVIKKAIKTIVPKKHTPELEKVDLIKVEKIAKNPDQSLHLIERVNKLQSLVMELNNQLCMAMKRIDRIVRAIDKSKSVRGL